MSLPLDSRGWPSCVHCDVSTGGNGVGAPSTVRSTVILLFSTTNWVLARVNRDGRTKWVR